MNEQHQPKRNNTCFDAGQLIAWRDGALPLQEADEVTAHLAVCARCATEDRALMRDRHEVFDLLSTLDPSSGTRTETAAAFSRFQERLTTGSTGSVLQYDDEDLLQEEFPQTELERYHSPVVPMKSSTRMHRIGALAQTFAAVLVVAALIGTSLLLFRHRLPPTDSHPTSATQAYATATARVQPTARAAADSYDSFVAINGIMFGFDAQHTHANPYERILNPTTVGGLKKQWAYNTGSSVTSSPAVVGGVVYVGSDDGYMYALDAATGAKQWAYWTGGSQVADDPAVVGGMVYFGSLENHTLYALDAASGTKKWAYPTGGPIVSSPAVVGGVVYVGSEDNTLYAFDAATGAKKWTYWTRGGIDSSPAVVDGVVYVGSGDGNVYALDAATGARKWAYQTGNPVEASPAVAKGVVYVGSHDGYMYALDAATGAKKWTYRTRGPMFSPPTVANGVVYVGAGWDNLYALDAATGAKKWAYPTGGMDSSPTVANGVVYVGALGANVYAFHLPRT